MQHPEEGIIHAWLDGALSPAEAAELEAHIASCAECRPRVAEARGLVAAASRIVSHLDAVPANVIPIAPKKKKLWSNAAWPVGIAAALVAAIGLASRKSEQVVERAPMSAVVAAVDSAGAGAVTAAPMTREPATVAPPKVPSIEATPRVRKAGGSVSPLDATTLANSVNQPLDASKAARMAAPAPAPVTAAPLPASAVSEQRASHTASTNAPVGVSATGSFAAGAAAGNAAARMRAPSAAPMRASETLDRADMDVVKTFAGCYEMNASTDILPQRFALVADTSASNPGLLEVRYLDANGHPTERMVDAGWSTEGGRATIKTSGRVLLTIAKNGSIVDAQSPVGPRTGRVVVCRP